MIISALITGTIIAQGVYASILLFIVKKNKSANKFLGILVCLSSFWLIDTFLRVTNSYNINPNLYFIPIFYSLGFGPLIYFYTNSITNSNYKFHKSSLYHLIPVIIQFVFYFGLFWSSYSFKRWYWLNIHKPYTYDLEFNLTLLSLVIYSFYSLKKIIKYQNLIKNQFSEISKIHLNWLKILQYSLVIICVFWLIEALLREVFLFYAQQPISAYSLSICILLIATGGILQPNLKLHQIDLINEFQDDTFEKVINRELLELIQREMEFNKYFLDSNLTLKMFSSYLNIPPRKVSFHINQGLNLTFIDFVNNYRVECVKQKMILQSFDYLTLYGIALECGFNSKSTFNRVFKSMTGQTPSQYKNNTQNIN